jgi:NADPH2:quinone reductase
MRAILCQKYGPPQDLIIADVPEPTPGPGEILIDVHAAGVNFPDVLLVQGLYQIKPPVPFSPGVEVAGTVAALGEGVTHLRVGDRIVGSTMGGFADRAVGRASHAVPLPDDLDFVTAAGMLLTYGTAYHGLVDCGRLAAGETLFVSGAGGGVGTAAVDIAHALGARVIATASSDAKREAAKSFGADVVIDAEASDLVDQLKAAGNGGIDVALDNVGGAQFDAALRSARWQARLLIVGFAGGTIPQIPANRLLLKELDVRGVYWGDWTARNAAANRANFAAMFDLMKAGKLAPRVDATYAFEQAPQGRRALEMI